MIIDSVEKTCSSCATTFKCGGDCWCNDLPSILPVNTEEECLCQICMTSILKETIADHMNNLSLDKIKVIQKLGRPKNIIEGIDYTLNKQGALVFTSWYLLRQGKCCGNGCLNCPYSPSNEYLNLRADSKN